MGMKGRRYAEQYVQTLTREIKSPPSAIRGAAELLQEDMPSVQQARFLREEMALLGLWCSYAVPNI